MKLFKVMETFATGKLCRKPVIQRCISVFAIAFQQICILASFMKIKFLLYLG